MSSSSPIQPSGSSSADERKRFTSPIICDGASWIPSLTSLSTFSVSRVDDELESGRQAMNVSLSASVRQLLCMAYSSSRVRGSEAVVSWISWCFLVDVPIFNLEEIGRKVLNDSVVPHLSSIRGRSSRAISRMGRGGLRWLIMLEMRY